MLTVAQELEEKTTAYWNVSKAFFAGVGVDLNTQQAIKMCVDTKACIGPSRPLLNRVAFLQDKIIQGRSKRRKTDMSPNPVVHLQLKPAVSI